MPGPTRASDWSEPVADKLQPIELLAPAGNPACALAAFDAGADAIYAGLPRFNARERGENFSADDMAKIVDYAHRHGRKVYVTTNTLIKETELPDLVEQLAQLDDIAPDALLVQDLGVMRIAREYFPHLTLHASTQMGIHNSAGFAIAKELGATRVVLERQVTLEELAEIRSRTDLEIEVFVHGALCASLSGCCFFSSYLGGASGNRGKCKQPCRRRYFSRSGNGFFFSPQDLCSLELLPQMRKLGVASLKIEGRLRQPDYVTAAVTGYRMMLDAAPEEYAETLKAARNVLSSGCGRRWSHGFYTTASTADLIKHDALGAAGLRVGTVEAVGSNGFGFTAAKRLHLGDRVRIQPQSGDVGPAITITKMFVNNVNAKRVLPGERVFICCDKEVSAQGVVFKIGESFPDYSGRLAALPPRRARLDLDVTVTASEFRGKVKNTVLPEFARPLNLRPAKTSPLAPERIAEEFSASGSKAFELGHCDCRIDGAYFFPAAELKALRREFWAEVAAKLDPAQVLSDTGIALERFRKDYLAQVPAEFPANSTETVAVKAHGAEPADRKAIRAAGVYEVDRLCREAILPEFCPEGRLENLKRAIQRAYESGIRRFRVTSLYGLELLKGMSDVTICSSFPLPICNSMTVQEMRRFGVERCMVHLELERTSIEALQKHSVLPLELYRLGRFALLTSRAPLPVEGDVRDGRGNEFVVRFDRRDGLSRIFPKLVHSVPRMPGLLDFYDLTNANWKNFETGSFNFEGNWL